MGDAILGGQLVDEAELHEGWRARAARDRASPRAANFERHPWIIGAMRPRPRAIPGPNSLRHFDQSVAALADTDLDVQTKMEIIALVDDYVFGFSLRAFIAVLETREEQAEPGWMQAVFDYMRSAARDRGLPATSRASRRPTAPRAAGTRTSPRWPSTRGASNAGSTASSTASRSSSSGVVEDDAERRAPAGAHRRHAVAHGRPVVAAGAQHRAVAGGEDQEGAALAGR